MTAVPRSQRRSGAGPRSVLADAGLGLGRPLVHSALLHGGLLAMLLAGWTFSDDEPPPPKPEAFYVSAVVLPKAAALPDKATRAPKPDPGQAGTKKAPPPKPDQMVLPDKTAEKREGKEEPPKEPPKREEPKPKSRAELLAERGDLSDQDRFATDVDGDPDAKPTTLDPRFGRAMSRYDREIHDRVKERWQPGLALVSQVDEGVSTVISFTITESGAVVDLALAQGSGNYAFDMSCVAAVQRAGTLPKPPRAPWPVAILFRPEEKK